MHPFMAPAQSVGIEVPQIVPDSAPQTARTIGNLNPIPAELKAFIREFLLPSEFHNQENGTKANFRVSLGDLIESIKKADLGLENVDNTSDKSKPISTDTQNALDKKLDSDWNPEIKDIQGLEELLSKFYSTDNTISMEDIEDLVRVLSTKSDNNHTHSEKDFELWLPDVLKNFSKTDHSHSLDSLKGWNEFLQSLTEALGRFVTKDNLREAVGEFGLVVVTDEWP